MEIIEKTIGEEFHICDTCGYEKGFHISFVRRENDFEIVFICPQCGQRFKVNWGIKLG